MNAAGIPSDRIIEISNPYALPQQFNPENTIFVAVVGSPDKNRLNPDSTKKDGSASYFKMFDSFEKAVTADQHGYVIIADERNKQITLGDKTVDVSHGTQTRAAWNAVRKDPKLRSQFLKQMYGRDDPEVGRVLDKIAETVNENGGYVPMNKKEANDDRFRMALSVDVGIGEPWKQAKKMGLLKDKIQILGEEIEALKEKLVAEAPPKPVIKAVAPTTTPTPTPTPVATAPTTPAPAAAAATSYSAPTTTPPAPTPVATAPTTPTVATGIKGAGGYSSGEYDLYKTALATGALENPLKDVQRQMGRVRGHVDRVTIPRTGNIAPTQDIEPVLHVNSDGIGQGDIDIPAEYKDQQNKKIYAQPVNLPGGGTLDPTLKDISTYKGRLGLKTHVARDLMKPTRDIMTKAIDGAEKSITDPVTGAIKAADAMLLKQQGRTVPGSTQSYLEDFTRSIDELVNEKWSND
tara:strand:- start:541 stop:1929 length:1389 start_codon:yes stop_codon:yes gene_type:complete